MNSLLLSQWRASFAAVPFETDQSLRGSELTDTLNAQLSPSLGAIDERLQSLSDMGTIERKSIEAAQRSLAALEREPGSRFVPGLRLENTATVAQNNPSDLQVKGTPYGIGSQVRVTLPSGDVVSAEIVVIFTASSRNNILVAFDKLFMRIGPEQILDVLSARAFPN